MGQKLGAGHLIKQCWQASAHCRLVCWTLAQSYIHHSRLAKDWQHHWLQVSPVVNRLAIDIYTLTSHIPLPWLRFFSHLSSFFWHLFNTYTTEKQRNTRVLICSGWSINLKKHCGLPDSPMKVFLTMHKLDSSSFYQSWIL